MQTLKTGSLFCGLCLSCSFLTAQSFPDYVPADGLLGWWAFDGDANDGSGNGYNGVVEGATLTEDRFGVSGKAYRFNGSTDYIEVADALPLRLNSTDFSFSFWVEIDSYNVSATALLVKRSAGSTNGWMLSASAPFDYRMELKTSESSDPNMLSDSSLSTGIWHHVALVFREESTADFYLNGTLNNIALTSGLFFNADCDAVLRFGQDTRSPSLPYYLNGAMDDIGIWDRALEPAEVEQLYLGMLTSIESPDHMQWSYHPNPVQDLLYIRSTPELLGSPVRLYNTMGKVVHTTSLTQNQTLDLSGLPDGLYYLQVGTADLESLTLINR